MQFVWIAEGIWLVKFMCLREHPSELSMLWIFIFTKYNVAKMFQMQVLFVVLKSSAYFLLKIKERNLAGYVKLHYMFIFFLIELQFGYCYTWRYLWHLPVILILTSNKLALCHLVVSWDLSRDWMTNSYKSFLVYIADVYVIHISLFERSRPIDSRVTSNLPSLYVRITS